LLTGQILEQVPHPTHLSLSRNALSAFFVNHSVESLIESESFLYLDRNSLFNSLNKKKLNIRAAMPDVSGFVAL
jgi:hypothetical protein